MALLRAKRKDIPRDAVVLTERDAVQYQIETLNSWNKSSDVFAYRYGGLILSAAGAAVGFYMNNYYRLKLRLSSYGRMSSYLPICVIPSLLTYLVHTEFVLPDVVLQKGCPICTEVRASSLQVTLGCALPVILAPISSFPLAMQYNTYKIPYLTKEPAKVFQFWRAKTQPIFNTILFLFLGQAVLATSVTYFEAKSVEKVNNTMLKLEEENIGLSNIA